MHLAPHLHLRPSLRIGALALANGLLIGWLLAMHPTQALAHEHHDDLDVAAPTDHTHHADDRIGDDGGHGSPGDDGDARLRPTEHGFDQ